MCALKTFVAFMAVMALAAPAAQARMLKKSRDWGEIGDSNGYDVLASARRFEGGPGTPKRAVTPEAAESTANNMFLGLWRREIPKDSSVVFATVESDPNFVNPDRKPQTVMPRGRVAIDSTTSKKVDQVSGNAMIPTVAMGGASVAQTYEGALAVSASDAISVAGKNRHPENAKETTHANSMITSYAHDVPRASKAASYGVTAQNANSVSLAGPSDGNMVVAQAHETAAVAQASRSNADQWQTSDYPKRKGSKDS